MNITTRSISCVIIFLSLFSCKKEEISATYLIKNVEVVDIEKGLIKSSLNVAISGKRITDIYAGKKNVNDSVQIIDGSGKYLIPGLWDMHTHYNWNYYTSDQLLVANGVTGIREMWGVMDTIQSIRDRVSAGILNGPDIYTAGNIIDGIPPIWPGSAGVADAVEAVAEVNRQLTENVDFFKVYSLLTKDAYMAIAEESRKNGVPFAGHVPQSVTLWEAIEAGQQSAEHLYGLLEVCSSDPEKLGEFSRNDFSSTQKTNFLVETFDQKRFDSLASVLSKSETWLSPTLTVLRSISNLDDTTLFQDSRMEYLPDFFKQFWKSRTPREAGYYDAARSKFRLQLSLMGALERAGVRIIAGTDYPNPFCFPGFSLHDELELMVEGGMTAAGALRTATINPAIFMKKEGELGKVDSGHLASLVLLDENPLENIANTRSIRAVFLRGEYLDRPKLDELLLEVKSLVAN